ncbi:testis-expressed protein 2 isoform X1 [Hypanus sabinus]|uniref:testis-expressed protein 2 isoform X1 n=1 Tax=Hypanus sabinus TaxID=79690 RepID=UPI0028C3B4A1|nr:testis-expressed protein 2 isoform X1 [Hypanus sabinus]XP_059804255.1 testis-expressed protein 2 isoform X1 [Hypanus sabinus]
MTSQSGSHAERAISMSSTPKVQVQRSVSRETITIHFSAFGKEEEEEEEEEFENSSTVLHEEVKDQSFVPELKEKASACKHGGQLLSVPATSSNSSAISAAVTFSIPSSASTMTSSESLELSSASTTTAALPLPLPSLLGQPMDSTSLSSEVKATVSASGTDTPSQHIVPSTLPSSSMTSTKPFASLVKSLSTEVDPKESNTPLRTRDLMKTLVKSLSTDTSKQESESVAIRTSDSRINLHLFKQFTQPRVTGGDSKTAPSSPITSPSEGRSFFKVTEVEARIEDTKRRLSEVIYEPFQLLSKIISDESSSLRHRALSSSATELSTLSSLNGHLESNNNYSIKEEECDSDEDYSTKDSILCKSSSRLADEPSKEGDMKSSSLGSVKESFLKGSPLSLDKCSLSVLASKEENDYCDLFLEAFEMETEEEIEDKPVEPLIGEVIKEESEILNQDGKDFEVQSAEVPFKILLFFTTLVYSYLVLPLPSYLNGLFLGISFGFMMAIGVVWLLVPRKPRDYQQSSRRIYFEYPTTEPLDIKEPEIFKGWMNEIYNYDPETYHATLTHSVYIRLEGSVLRLSKPNKNISRRASFNEARTEVTYISQKIYDLSESKVHLVPKDLARKRVWNKKYPICIELARQDDFMSKAQTERENVEEKISADKVETMLEEMKKSSGSQDSAKPICQKDQILYLFGRTGREKEEWFRKFILASKSKTDIKRSANLGGGGALPGFVPSHSRNNSQSGMLTHSRNSSKGSIEEIASHLKQKDLLPGIRQKMLLDYAVYMAKYIPEEISSPSSSPIHSAEGSPTAKLPTSQNEDTEQRVAWVNALLGRIFWDFLGEKYWSNLVSRKIQMKLSKIRLPYFMNELTLTELDMGVAMPRICQASKPCVNYQGLWIDLEISYNGSFLMTLETKMNLTKLGKESLGEGYKVGDIGKEGNRPKAYCLADSDEESSSAGSSDEEDAQEVLAGDKVLPAAAEGYMGVHRPSKIMRLVDKITKSKYFQKATETEFIKKKIEEVSNTPLLLTVEVQECKGTLAVNIPPPPTDRIWYGFRTPPHLELKARPKLGEREVTIAHVTDWIEKKLEQEFQKIFVMPNMDDVYVPIMHSAMDPRSSTVWPSRETQTEFAERQ